MRYPTKVNITFNCDVKEVAMLTALYEYLEHEDETDEDVTYESTRNMLTLWDFMEQMIPFLFETYCRLDSENDDSEERELIRHLRWKAKHISEYLDKGHIWKQID